MNENAVNALTKLRVKLDAVGHQTSVLPKGRYVALATTSLEKGRMYVGEVCLNLGHSYPYESTKDAKTPQEIAEAVDKSNGQVVLDMGYHPVSIAKATDDVVSKEIVNLNAIRQNIQIAINEFLGTVFHPDDAITEDRHKQREYFMLNANVSEAYRGLIEARMWLGKRLGEIRDNAKTNEE